MSKPVASEGPTTGTHQRKGKWAEFAQAILGADGEWVELEVSDETYQSSGYTEVYRYIGARYAEIRKIRGVMYGRKKES